MVTVKVIIIGALGTISKNLEKGLEKLKIQQRIKIVQTTALSRLIKRVDCTVMYINFCYNLNIKGIKFYNLNITRH